MLHLLSKETLIEMLQAEGYAGQAVEQKLAVAGLAANELAEHVESRDNWIASLQADITDMDRVISTQRNTIANLEMDLEIAETRLLEARNVGLRFCDEVEEVMTEMAQDFVDYIPVDLFMEYGMHQWLPVAAVEEDSASMYAPNFILIDINHIETGE